MFLKKIISIFVFAVAMSAFTSLPAYAARALQLANRAKQKTLLIRNSFGKNPNSKFHSALALQALHKRKDSSMQTEFASNPNALPKKNILENRIQTNAKAMQFYWFEPNYKIITESLFDPATDEELLKEPSFDSASYQFARKHGGPLIQRILDRMTEIEDIQKILNEQDPKLNIIIDSYVQALEKGEHPQIKGWHTDSIPISEENAKKLSNYRLGYPQFDDNTRIYFINISNRPEGVSQIEILTNSLGIKLPGEGLYDQLYDQLNDKITSDPICYRNRTNKIEDRTAVLVHSGTIRRYTPAIQSGIQLFLRVALVSSQPEDKLRSP